MQKTTLFFLGIDVSKLWFDACLMQLIEEQKQPLLTQRFSNDAPGIKAFNKWLKTYHVTFDDSTLLVIENTGVYHRLLWQYCSHHNLPLHIANAAHIKWSFGITRGKNDRVDAERLCMYGYRHRDELKATPTLDADLLQLKDLLRSRQRLLSQINSTRVYLGELKGTKDREMASIIERAHKAALQGMQASLKVIEEHIQKLVKAKEAFAKNYRLLMTVPGIGWVTAAYLIGWTANFAAHRTGKQLASYAGVVPFEHSSGKSVKGKSKVHRMANKELKALLHMGAMSGVRHCGEYKAYYERKKAAGKEHNYIINSIKNKMVLRAVSVVSNQRRYVDKWGQAGVESGQKTGKKDLVQS